MTGQPSPLRDQFGLLRFGESIVFEDIRIEPVANYSEVITWADNYEHRDGFLYPPPSRTVQFDPATDEPVAEIPKTKRPAFMWKVPASHSLIARTELDRDAFRHDAGLFIIHLLAYFFGTRLQFHDWWVDARVATKPAAHVLNPSQIVSPFLTTAYDAYRKWSEADRQAITNLLYMHSRIPGYEWVWERFAFEYMVLDGLYALAAPRHGLPPRGQHGKRIERLCEMFGVPFDKTTADRIVNLRNDLFHQVNFGQSAPGFGGHGDVFVLPYRLRDLNRRIIAASLGWDVPFVHSPWWTLSSVPFDL